MNLTQAEPPLKQAIQTTLSPAVFQMESRFKQYQGWISKNIQGVARGWQEILRGGTAPPWQKYTGAGHIIRISSKSRFI